MKTFTKRDIAIPCYAYSKKGHKRQGGFGTLYVDVINDEFYVKKIFFKKIDALRGHYYKDEAFFKSLYIVIVSEDEKRLFDNWLDNIKSCLTSHWLLQYIKQTYKNENLTKQEVSQ